MSAQYSDSTLIMVDIQKEATGKPELFYLHDNKAVGGLEEIFDDISWRQSRENSNRMTMFIVVHEPSIDLNITEIENNPYTVTDMATNSSRVTMITIENPTLHQVEEVIGIR